MEKNLIYKTKRVKYNNYWQVFTEKYKINRQGNTSHWFFLSNKILVI